MENADELAMYLVFQIEQEITLHTKLLPPLFIVMLSPAMLVPQSNSHVLRLFSLWTM